MARYDTVCDACGWTDEVMRLMSEVEPGQSWGECQICAKSMRRVYAVPADHSENTFRPWYSSAMSTEDNRVYVKSRGQMKEIMARRGLGHYEPGIEKDRARARDARREEGRKAIRNGADEALRRAINEVG